MTPETFVCEPVVSHDLVLRIPITNPVFVHNDKGEIIGSAFVNTTSDGFGVDLNLAKSTPEAFDLENNPRVIKFQLSGEIRNDGLHLKITLV